MSVWIALLRGINVGGRNKLPMKELTALLERIGCTDVKTYIQSGNVVFRSRAKHAGRLGTKISAAIGDEHGFEPQVLVIDREQLLAAAKANPFRAAEREADGKALHVFFLAAKPARVDRAALDATKRESESWKVIDRALYLHAPDGVHGSKLAGKVERILGVPATARNWRTVSKLVELAPPD